MRHEHLLQDIVFKNAPCSERRIIRRGACRYCASKIGSYSLTVTGSRDGEPLAGSPFQFDVTTGQLSPCHCTAALAAPSLVAGEEAAIVIDAKDMHGNQVGDTEN